MKIKNKQKSFKRASCISFFLSTRLAFFSKTFWAHFNDKRKSSSLAASAFIQNVVMHDETQRNFLILLPFCIQRFWVFEEMVLFPAITPLYSPVWMHERTEISRSSTSIKYIFNSFLWSERLLNKNLLNTYIFYNCRWTQ